MAKKDENKQAKPRADKYDEKVRFDGTLEQMIKIAVKPKNKPSDKQQGK